MNTCFAVDRRRADAGLDAQRRMTPMSGSTAANAAHGGASPGTLKSQGLVDRRFGRMISQRGKGLKEMEFGEAGAVKD